MAANMVLYAQVFFNSSELFWPVMSRVLLLPVKMVADHECCSEGHSYIGVITTLSARFLYEFRMT